MAVDDVDRSQALRLTPVSRETQERLDLLVAELRRWQQAKNLVSSQTLDNVWTRHIADSLQLRPLVPEAKRWLDLGSGGGFPGLVIGILMAEEEGASIDLVESNARKCAFLRHAARMTGASVRVHQARIEHVAETFSGKVEVVTARALAPLSSLIDWCQGLLRNGVVGVFPKGQHLDAELTIASKCWKIQPALIQSVTDSSARIVLIRGLERQ